MSCATNRKVAGLIPAGVCGFFIDIKSFRQHCGPGVDSASNRNEYQEYFLGGKDGRCIGLTTLLPSCAVVTKSGNLKFLIRIFLTSQSEVDFGIALVILYMFQATLCSSSGGQIVLIQHLV